MSMILSWTWSPLGDSIFLPSDRPQSLANFKEMAISLRGRGRGREE